MIRRFLISTFQMSGAVAIRSVTALILNKLIAVFAGPSGITLFSHLQNLLAIVIHLPQDGINKGYIKLFQATPEDGRQLLLKEVLFFNFIITSVPIAVTAIAHEFFWGRFGEVKSSTLIITFIAASFIIVLYITLLSHFQALRKFGVYSILSSILAVLVLTGSGWMLYQGSFKDFLITYLIMQASGFVIAYFYYIRQSGSIPVKGKLTIEKEKVRVLLEYLIMAASVLIFTYVTDFVVRNYAIDMFGSAQTGLWQAVVKLSDYYKALFTVVVGAVFYAELTVRAADKKLIREYFKKILLLIIPGVGICLIIIYLLRSSVIHLLFDKEFVPAIVYLPYQLAGDFFALIAYLFVYLLMAEKRTKKFIMVQAFSTVVYLILIWSFISFYGLEGIVMAHFYRNIFFLLLVVVVNKKLFV